MAKKEKKDKKSSKLKDSVETTESTTSGNELAAAVVAEEPTVELIEDSTEDAIVAEAEVQAADKLQSDVENAVATVEALDEDSEVDLSEDPGEYPEEETAVSEAETVPSEDADAALKANLKVRVKRTVKKVEVPESSLEFVANFPVKDILPRERNTRFRGKETERVLSQMIQRFGWVQPLTLDADHRIVDGQYRYELAVKWGTETVPVVISNGVSVEEGTTDLFHMLAGRIAEWDKWNYPATDAILKSLDGGLTTEKVLGFETTSEAGPLRDLARELGWFIEVIPKNLSGTTVTLETLATLLKKQLAGKYHYDPAQLLYIEAIRAQLEGVRKEMVANGETAGGVQPKLEQHLREEERKLIDGEAIAADKGYVLEVTEDESTAVFTADKEIAYVVNKVAVAEEAAKKQVTSAKDMESRFRVMADGKKVGLGQFLILATYFTDMTEEEARDYFNSTSHEVFNAFVDSVLEENRTISPNRSKNFPLNETEFKAEQKRLKEEDARKSGQTAGKSKPQGLSSMVVDRLKDLLRAEGLPLSGKKAELVARLEEAGYGADGIKAEAEGAEVHAEEQDADTVDNSEVVDSTVDAEEADVEESLEDEELTETVQVLKEEAVEAKAVPADADVEEVLRAEAAGIVVGEIQDEEISELLDAEEPFHNATVNPEAQKVAREKVAAKRAAKRDESVTSVEIADEEKLKADAAALISRIAKEGREAAVGILIASGPESAVDVKALKKRFKELKKINKDDLSKAERKELKSLKSQLKELQD